MAVLSEDGILRNFTYDDFEAFFGEGGGEEYPAAVLTTVAPATVAHGAPNTTITLTGTGFVSGAVVKAGAASLATTFVSATSLTAVIPAASLVTAGTLQITVVNPSAPASGAKSFTVT